MGVDGRLGVRVDVVGMTGAEVVACIRGGCLLPSGDNMAGISSADLIWMAEIFVGKPPVQEDSSRGDGAPKLAD